MDLSTYIRNIGDEAACRLFGLKLRIVKSYRNGERRPRPDRALDMIEASGGKLTWEGIYAPKRDER